LFAVKETVTFYDHCDTIICANIQATTIAVHQQQFSGILGFNGGGI